MKNSDAQCASHPRSRADSAANTQLQAAAKPKADKAHNAMATLDQLVHVLLSLLHFIDNHNRRVYTLTRFPSPDVRCCLRSESQQRAAMKELSIPMKPRSTFKMFSGAVLVTAALFVLSVAAGAVQGDKNIRMYDDCEPASFDAVLGVGACVGKGHTTFDEFIQELQETQDAHAWRNQPSVMQVNVGRPTFIENRGGETHTFTPVAAFGGGFVNQLNGISGNPVPAPECLNIGALIFIPAGGSASGPTAGSTDLPVGTHNFQCCIHPWMRTVIQVEDPHAQAVESAAGSENHHGHHQ
jgi:hypothetical protein